MGPVGPREEPGLISGYPHSKMAQSSQTHPSPLPCAPRNSHELHPVDRALCDVAVFRGAPGDCWLLPDPGRAESKSTFQTHLSHSAEFSDVSPSLKALVLCPILLHLHFFKKIYRGIWPAFCSKCKQSVTFKNLLEKQLRHHITGLGGRPRKLEMDDGLLAGGGAGVGGYGAGPQAYRLGCGRGAGAPRERFVRR